MVVSGVVLFVFVVVLDLIVWCGLFCCLFGYYALVICLLWLLFIACCVDVSMFVFVIRWVFVWFVLFDWFACCLLCYFVYVLLF